MAAPLAVFSLSVALAAAVGAARAEVEFTGYVQAVGGAKFVLADAAAGKASEWLTVGGAFGGYTVVAFDAQRETLTVERGGTTTRLALKAGHIRPGAAWEPPVTPAEIEAGLARFVPNYAYNRERGTWELTGFGWKRLTPETIEREKAAAEKAARETKAARELSEQSQARREQKAEAPTAP